MLCGLSTIIFGAARTNEGSRHGPSAEQGLPRARIVHQAMDGYQGRSAGEHGSFTIWTETRKARIANGHGPHIYSSFAFAGEPRAAQRLCRSRFFVTCSAGPPSR